MSSELRTIINKYKIKNSNDFYLNKEIIFKDDKIDKIMNFSESFLAPDKKIKEALKKTVINSQKAQLMDGKGSYIIRNLFDAYFTTPNQLPDHVILKVFTDYGKKGIDEITKYHIGELRDEMKNKSLNDKFFFVCLCRCICDYISSMTDRYALKQYENLYEPIILM